jgi:hypothetical protein
MKPLSGNKFSMPKCGYSNNDRRMKYIAMNEQLPSVIENRKHLTDKRSISSQLQLDATAVSLSLKSLAADEAIGEKSLSPLTSHSINN